LSPSSPELEPLAAVASAAEAPLTRVALRLAYDGSAFHGWQIQDHRESIEARLERALTTALRRPTRIFGSGRTDAGVHALNQAAHCDVPQGADLARLRSSLNALAGPYIAVKEILPVPPDFHARHSATGKTYRYQIQNRPYPAALARQRCWWIRLPLNVPAMREASQVLLGRHDFSAFRASQCAAPSPVRDMRRIGVSEGEWPDGTLRIELEASGFLQHMARIIVGNLTAVGLGKLSARDLAAILESRDRTRAAMTAPAKGLYLLRVDYDWERVPALRDWGRES